MNEASITLQRLYTGIDLHKKQWTVSIFTEKLHHKTFSQPPTCEALKTYLDKHFPDAEVHCVYEASKLGFWTCRQLRSYGYHCLVVNPADVPTTSKESLEKTDKIDSRKLARALRGGLLRSIYVPSVEAEGHRQLFRYRKRLQGDLVRIKNRIKDRLLFSGIQLPEKFDKNCWSKAFLAYLTALELPSPSATLTLKLLLDQYQANRSLLLQTTRELRKLLKLAVYRDNAQLLLAIPGIGPLTCLQLLCEIEDIDRFANFRQLNSFIGFKPMEHSSGEKEHKGRISLRRHNSLRSDLIECAWSSVQHDPALNQAYQQLCQRMSSKRAMVKIARKLLSRIWHVLKTGEPYQIGLAA